jgi:hypothetical protein
MEVEARQLKLLAFNSMLNKLQPVQMREAEDTANILLSLIERMKIEVFPLPRRYSQFEAYAYNALGRIALYEGKEESARRAAVYFQKVLKVSKAIGNDESVAAAKTNIALAKSVYESGNSEELIKASRELYKSRLAQYGEENDYTIIAGKNYASSLQNANRGGEAKKLLAKLLAMSKQVLGPHHTSLRRLNVTLKW